MKARLAHLGRLLMYPAFYLFCLVLFGTLCFPYDQLKTRIIAEFDRIQQSKRRRSSDPPMRLEIDDLDGHWLTGVALEGARLTLPAKAPSPAEVFAAMRPGASSSSAPSAPSVIAIDRATARVRLLPLLVGDVRIDFSADVFAGEVNGTVPYGVDAGDVDVELEGIQLAVIAPLRSLLQGLPIAGVLGGALELRPKESKFSKSDGKLEIHIDDVVIGDGETKVQGVALPAAQVGQIAITANVKDGLLVIDDFHAQGRDFEMNGSGKVRLHESWDRSSADITITFKFADVYRDKDDATRSLLGKAGDKFPPAIEIAPGSPFKAAKTDDGYYRFHITGPLGRLAFEPAGEGASKGARGRRRTAKTGRPSEAMPRLPEKLGRPTPAPMEDEPPEPERPSPRAEERAADDAQGHVSGAARPGAEERPVPVEEKPGGEEHPAGEEQPAGEDPTGGKGGAEEPKEE